MYPPTRHCHKCGRQLKEIKHHTAVLFEDKGAQAALTTSLGCRRMSRPARSCHKLSLTYWPALRAECSLRYYHDYVVSASKDTRTYYAGLRDILQVNEHAFITRDLLESQTNMMNVAWSVTLTYRHTSLPDT